ncbi:MAG: glycosyltransferase family 4 protein [Bacteroidetes bacterium]|nr:glycosyltransferase family 4 protein [Bacteroidota bacterium]
MKILQICNKAPYPANDGSSIAICTLAEGLADAGAELHLLAINTKKHFKPDENIPAEFKRKTHYRSVYRNTDTSAAGALMNLFSSESYFVSRFHFREFAEALENILNAHTFDIIQIEGVFMVPYLPLLRRLSKARIVLRPHNVEHQIWERHLKTERNPVKKWYLNLQNKRLKRFELMAFREADAIVPITDLDKENIGRIEPAKPMYTCLTGVDMAKYKACTQPKEEQSAFHFASMDWMPNIEAADWLMNEVWPLVKNTGASVKLVLAGRGMPERFKAMAGNGVEVREQVDSSAVFYDTYDIMLVPLWSGSGLRIKLVEGLAYAKPIITTSIGAEGVPYENGKHLVIADTKEQFAEAIVKLASDKAIRRNLGLAARNLAENHFDYRRIAENLLHFYKSKLIDAA